MMDAIILPRKSDQKPLVSVISLTYNHEPYIRDCLEGFLKQKTNFPIEIIIHDDASTDHTADIIREYYEKRPDLFHVIIEKENQYSQHKNFSLSLYEKAKGKYIALCEGDDYWTDPLKLQKQFDFMEKRNEYSLCFHKVIEKDEVGTGQHIRQICGRVKSRDIFPTWSIPTCSCFFKKEVSEEYSRIRKKYTGFNCGDIVLFLTALSLGKGFGLNDVMGVYRRNQGGVTIREKEIRFTNNLQHLVALKKSFPVIKNEVNGHIVFILTVMGNKNRDQRKRYTKAIRKYGVDAIIRAYTYRIRNKFYRITHKNNKSF